MKALLCAPLVAIPAYWAMVPLQVEVEPRSRPVKLSREVLALGHHGYKPAEANGQRSAQIDDDPGAVIIVFPPETPTGCVLRGGPKWSYPACRKDKTR